jgi:hypothetical protein
MDVELWLDLRGPDAVFLATTTSFVTMLGDLEVYKSAPEHLGHAQMSSHLGQYKIYYEGGKNGDRINISLRKGCRETLTLSCRKALYYLQAVASEADIPKLLQGGVTLRRRPRRKAAAKSETIPS